MTRFNVNSVVKVKLTERGRKILRQQHQAYVDAFPGVFEEFEPKKVDADGWSEFQLWDLMATFGQHCGNGLPVPFETEIEIPMAAGVAHV